MRRVAAFLVGMVVACTAHAELIDRFNEAVRPIGRVFARAVGRSLPVPAASSGITFTFDPATSAFERETEILGQIFLERARPIGRGKVNVSFTYQWVRFDTFDGHELRGLRDVGIPIVDTASGHRLRIPRFDIGLETHQMTSSLSYGVTDDLELNLTVPLLHTTLDVDSRLRDVTDGHRQGDVLHDTELGVGDLFLRGKYRFAHGWLGDLAAGLAFRLPAGNQNDFQGTGDFELAPMLYATTPAIEAAPGMRLQGYLNAGVGLVPEHGSRSEGRYGIGLDCMLAERVTLSAAFLAREPFGRLVAPGFFDVPRANGERTPIFGLRSERPSYYDISVGARVNLWRDSVFGVANVIVPANRDGVRASVIPLIGIEATF